MSAAIMPAALSTAADWRDAIYAMWSGLVEGIVGTGRLLLGAKEALQHGDFEAMVEAELPFGPRAAQMLMAIARNPVLSNAKHRFALPPSWERSINSPGGPRRSSSRPSSPAK